MRHMDFLGRVGVPRRGWMVGAVALAAVLLGCSDSTKPDPAELYGWRINVEVGPGSFDSVAFHWPRSAMPLAIWAEDRLELPAHVATAIDRWRDVLGDDRFDARLVPDSADADIIVRGVYVNNPAPRPGAAVRHLPALAEECEGGTVFDVIGEDRTLVTPIRFYVVPRFDPETVDMGPCYDVTVTHELGHALGLFQHSPVAFDVMYRDPTVAEPSYRDRATIQTLYAESSDLTPVRAE